MSSTFASILVEDSPRGLAHVRLLTVNRPQVRNALDAHSAKELTQAIAEADHDSNISVLVLTGAGEHAFCAGADLSGIFSDESTSLNGGVSALGELLLQIRNCRIPIISAVNGIAVGGGFGIILASDLVVLSEKAKIGTPEIRRGLFAMFIARFVYENLPEKIANEILFLGETLTPQQALELKIVNRVVPHDDLLTTALDMAKRIAAHSGSVLRLGKSAFHKQKDLPFDDAISFLGAQLSENLSLEDTQAGIKSFLKKD